MTVIINDNSESLPFCAGPDEDKIRLDKFLAAHCPDLSRSRLKALILDGAVTLGGAPCTDPARKIRSGETLSLNVPPPEDSTPQPENIPLDILYEDESLLVINKPAGLVVHPGAGNPDGTLVNALLHHCHDSLSGIGGVKRPGIVHRLDKDTSGLMIVAKNDKAHKSLSAQLADRSLTRQYYALVWKAPRTGKGKVEKTIGRHHIHRQKMAVGQRGGRAAVTHYRTIQTYGAALALLECTLESGRTHQIRVHMESIGHPLAGDTLYGLQQNAGRSLLRKEGYDPEVVENVMNFPRQALHAFHLRFIHPLSGEAMDFTAPLPDDIAALLEQL